MSHSTRKYIKMGLGITRTSKHFSKRSWNKGLHLRPYQTKVYANLATNVIDFRLILVGVSIVFDIDETLVKVVKL